MQKIIPTIFSTTKEEFYAKRERLKDFPIIHIDIMDNIFVKNKSLPLSFYLKDRYLFKKKLDIHLMVIEPLKYFTELSTYKNIRNIQRVFIHIEILKSCNDLDKIIKQFSSLFRIGLAINPETKINANTLNYCLKVENILLMSVYPGKEKQKFLVKVLDKINLLQEQKKFSYFIDGGINAQTIKYIKKIPLSSIYVGSYLSNSENSIAQYTRLKELLK